jgi:hypothetical protein
LLSDEWRNANAGDSAPLETLLVSTLRASLDPGSDLGKQVAAALRARIRRRHGFSSHESIIAFSQIQRGEGRDLKMEEIAPLR